MEERERGMRAEALGDRKNADNEPIGHRLVHDETRYSQAVRLHAWSTKNLKRVNPSSTTRTRSSGPTKVIVDFLQRQFDDFLPSAFSAAIKD